MYTVDASSSPHPKARLYGLLAAREDEVFECIHTEIPFDTDKLGKYFPALSNEAPCVASRARG